jgi:manganese transport protein
MGEEATGELLVLSQVILSLQLGFAIIPLIHFVSDKEKMQTFAIRPYIKALAWLSAVIIVSLNVKLVIEQIQGWRTAFMGAIWLDYIVIPLAIMTGVLLIYITVMPLFGKLKRKEPIVPHGGFSSVGYVPQQNYKRIAVALDFSDTDSETLKHALAQGGKASSYLLIHVTESPGAFFSGRNVRDLETEIDLKNMDEYIKHLTGLGYDCKGEIGYGSRKKAIVEKTKEFNADLLVMGAHGHQLLKDIFFGTTVNAVRHSLKIPVLIVR